MKKNSSPLLTKSEFSLLFGGLFILFSIFILNKKTDELDKVEQQVTKNLENHDNSKSTVLRAKREPSSNKVGAKRNVARLKTEDTPFEKLKTLEACIKLKNCNLPNTDPRSYNLAAYKQLADGIKNHRSTLLQDWNSKIAEDFKRYLNHHDGFVKEAALETVNQLDPSEASEFVDVVIESVLSDHNTQLMDSTMEYIQKLQDPGLKLKVENAWIDTMTTGSPNKSEALAKYSHHLINESSLQKFKRVLDQLPRESAERAHLESSLTEFEMTQSGG